MSTSSACGSHVYFALCVFSHVNVSEDGSCPRCGPDDNETAGRDYLGHPDGGCLVLYRVV